MSIDIKVNREGRSVEGFVSKNRIILIWGGGIQSVIGLPVTLSLAEEYAKCYQQAIDAYSKLLKGEDDRPS